VTRTSKTAPAGKARSNRRNGTQVSRPAFAGAVRLAALAGQRAWPQVTAMRAPTGALTASRLILTRSGKSVPRMLTIGKGYRTPALAGGAVIVILAAATLERPSAAVTRSLTT
jgi:hypothetical protein